MRVVFDTNIFISALLVQTGYPADIYLAWQKGLFSLIVCAEQLDELRATLQKPAIAARIKPHSAGRLVNQLKNLTEMVEALPRVQRSPDPADDYLLALAEAGGANYLVTGDKSGLLMLVRHKTTRILSAKDFAALLA
jgi:putative PIN family toxin of toxin-antitoxin system